METWEGRGENLDYQDLNVLIIKVFDNQLFPYLDYHERLMSFLSSRDEETHVLHSIHTTDSPEDPNSMSITSGSCLNFELHDLHFLGV